MNRMYVLLGLGILLLGSFSGALIATAMVRPASTSIVEAKEFRLCDDDGIVRGVWKFDEAGGDPVIHLMSDEGERLVTITAEKDGSAIILNTRGSAIASVMLDADVEFGGSLRLWDAKHSQLRIITSTEAK